VRSRMRP